MHFFNGGRGVVTEGFDETKSLKMGILNCLFTGMTLLINVCNVLQLTVI